MRALPVGMDSPLEPIRLTEEQRMNAKREAYLFKSQCKIKSGDTDKHVKARFPEGEDVYPRVHAAMSPRIIQDGALLSQPDGVYCYIVFQREGEEALHIACARTRSAWEFGTKHSAIVHILGLNTLLFAGEFIKTGTTLEYNFLSGTYLEPYNINKLADELEVIEAKRKKEMGALATALGLEAVFAKDPYESFIKTANMPILRDEIEELKSLGAVLSSYDSQKLCEQEETLAKKIVQIQKDIERLQGELEATRARLASVPPGVLMGGRRRSRRHGRTRRGSVNTRRHRRRA
jgi:hypothetical protein